MKSEKILNLLIGLILIDSIPDLLEFNNSLLGIVKLIINILTVLICLYILKEVNKNEWTSTGKIRQKNMAFVNAKYKKEFVLEFKEACKSLGITQSEVFREAMIKTIERAKKHQII